jgi:hypothetical protein
MKKPLPGSEELLGRVCQALTPNRLPLLIAIDGADDCGKSSLASWLAWQLGMPPVQLDLYLTSLHPIKWLETELARVVAHRLDHGRPIIIDGVCILDALGNIGRKADFLIFVTGGNETSSLAPQVTAYRSRRRPDEVANFKIDGYVENYR